MFRMHITFAATSSYLTPRLFFLDSKACLTLPQPAARLLFLPKSLNYSKSRQSIQHFMAAPSLKTRISYALTERLPSRLQLNPQGRVLLKTARILSSPEEYLKRRKMGAEIKRRTEPFVDTVKGYARLERATFEGTDDLIELCQKLFEQKREQLEPIWAGLSGKYRMLTETISDDDLIKYPGLVDFALSDGMLDAVTEYFGYFPLLRRVGMYVSSPQKYEGSAYSQLFHYDHGDFRQLKFFINVFDVSEDQGPFTFLPADVSGAVVPQLERDAKRGIIEQPEYGRFKDEDVWKYSKPENLVRATGPAGSGVATDTSRCLHFGSRVKEGLRVCYYMHFISYHFIAEVPSNYFDKTRFMNDPRRLLAISPKRTYARNHFFPDLSANEKTPSM